ncbi:MAG: hypothetical protein HN704_11285 [Bacteroidetes bacterium]|nr:hypothetical protein [Bacteroidota bacterium]MBT6687580.1 hypothetical protein [Bacteroidota bacterium]MBT7143579.1 hypothetical protein [Bacteroidota bacterium]MBT7492175.1 hypothetical protein [Bacteroidota bacterium]
MENRQEINSNGYIIKEECLASYEKGESFKEMVLEVKQPYPGYYLSDDYPGSKEFIPSYLFFIIKPFESFTEFNIIRITQKIKKTFEYDFDACPGRVSLFNLNNSGIRIKANDYCKIPELIELYKKNGVEFIKNKKVDLYSSMIKINKFFSLVYLKDGVFRAKDDASFRYIKLPHEIEWDLFYKVTKNIKNNYDFKQYDYALAAILGKEGYIDLVRIYSEDYSKIDLSSLKNKYFEEIDKLV